MKKILALYMKYGALVPWFFMMLFLFLWMGRFSIVHQHWISFVGYAIVVWCIPGLLLSIYQLGKNK